MKVKALGLPTRCEYNPQLSIKVRYNDHHNCNVVYTLFEVQGRYRKMTLRADAPLLDNIICS